MEKEEVMRLQHIRQTGIRYRQVSLWIVVGLTLAILLGCRVSAQCDSILTQLVNPLAVSVVFSLVASIAYGEAWVSVAKSSPANLAKFYLAASALKMMLAAVVFLVYVVLCGKHQVLGFTLVFALFYVVLLVFDCIYFSRVEKKVRLS